MKEIGYVGFVVIDLLIFIMVFNIFFIELNNSDNLYIEFNFYEFDVMSVRDNDFLVDLIKFEIWVKEVILEVDEDYYNYIIFKIDLNLKYNRDDIDFGDMYSYIKIIYLFFRVLMDN